MKKLKLPPRNCDTIDRLLLSENKNDNNSLIKHNKVSRIIPSLNRNMSNNGSFVDQIKNIDFDNQFDFKTKKYESNDPFDI